MVQVAKCRVHIISYVAMVPLINAIYPIIITICRQIPHSTAVGSTHPVVLYDAKVDYCSIDVKHDCMYMLVHVITI